MPRDALRIAYLCDMSPLDQNMYSGGNARIFETLSAHAGDVTILPQTWGRAEPLRRLILSAPDPVSLRTRWRAHYALRRIIAQQIHAELSRGQYDVLFGAYALHAMSGIRVPDGMVSAYTSDAVQTVYRLSAVGQAHARRFLMGPLLDNWVERNEAETLRSIDVLLWPSEWLRGGSQERYGLDPSRSHLVPWGANIDCPRRPAPRVLDRAAPVQFLVIGRDWFAKGGPVACDTMLALRERGVDARLTVIGCVPPEDHRNEHVTVYPQLDKSEPADLKIFDAALAQAHFMVMPSFESYGFAFCEAAAYGLPALCLRVGGVPVRDGISGHALPPGSGVEEFVASVLAYLDAPEAYSRLCLSARQEYEARLNWDAWGQKTATLLQDAVDRKRAMAGRAPN
jgi:glycosyltransferase involved in cell wall biosynthesis